MADNWTVDDDILIYIFAFLSVPEILSLRQVRGYATWRVRARGDLNDNIIDMLADIQTLESSHHLAECVEGRDPSARLPVSKYPDHIHGFIRARTSHSPCLSPFSEVALTILRASEDGHLRRYFHYIRIRSTFPTGT